MKQSLIILMALAASAAQAQGFAPLRLSDAGDVCYSWSGDTRTSAGSFSRCQPVIYLKPAPPPPPVVATPVVAPAPVVMQSCPPLPEPKPHRPIVKRKPKPVICH